MDEQRRRSLIMAGGGVKVAFQAGVLQVWLDEAKVEFDHADGASGGVFNLAMWCQGMTGTRIADNWRTYRPTRALDPNLGALLHLPFGESILRLERYRRNVLTAWGLSWPEIRSTTRDATFNLYNFSRHRQEVVPPSEMDEDRLISAVSLPMWFPPVRIEGDTYIDAVFVTDANLIDAVIEHGADELWVIWTVSERGEWYQGFVAQYFQMIEAMANGKFRADLARIARNNDAIARGENGEFGRPIEVRQLRAEVPLHYLLNLTQDRFAAAVELGVRAGRRWCRQQGIPLPPPEELARSDARRSEGSQVTTVSFTEEMAGYVGFDDVDYVAGERNGRAQGNGFMFHITITVQDLARFVVDPEHAAVAEGWVECEALGGRLTLEPSLFNLFVDQADPDDKRMLYQLWFRDGTGRPLTLAGHKVIRDQPGLDLWADTTTLFTHVVAGHVALADVKAEDVVASGILHISPLAFARQLTTFRATAPTAFGRVRGLARFMRLFVGSLWDVYARDVLSSSPF
jgi:predicted acylesterase/phospholipase RssA